MQVLQHSDPAGLFIVARQPAEGALSIQADSVLVVEEGQHAVLVADGRALDGFPPGHHTLSPAALPRLSEMLGRSPGDAARLEAAVAFVSTRAFAGLKWGTREPLAYRDGELGPVGLRAHGTFAVRIVEPGVFVDALAAAHGLWSTDAVERRLRDEIAARLGGLLSAQLASIDELPGIYFELAGRLGSEMAADLVRYGLELDDLSIGALLPPRGVARRLAARGGGSVLGGEIETYRAMLARRSAADPAGPEEAEGSTGDAGGAAATGVAGRAPRDLLADRGTAPPASCSQCGRDLVADASYCAFCGIPLTS